MLLQVKVCSSMAVAGGVRFSPPTAGLVIAAPAARFRAAATEALHPTATQSRSLSGAAGGGGAPSLSSSRSLFVRSFLCGFVAQGMFHTREPALARSRVSDIPEVLKNAEWPEDFPFRADDFQRFDESPDGVFYQQPRFVTHIDDPAIKALTKFYGSVFPPPNTPGTAVLDLCSSWVSHYPKNYKQERIVGMGMNDDELKGNPVLTEWINQDLNVDPRLPLEDNTFDVITNAVSVDYLTKPLQVFKEMNRVLKPGGMAIMSFSNRCFFTKAISIWTSTGDADHVLIVGAYFHYAGGFEKPQALDISPNPGRSDPMYVVFAKKLNV